MIMLIGIASKNGILIVEFINQLREQGMELNEAITTASARRLRPILMTALATILGILPIAMALGVGSASRQSMGIAVIGGLIVATLLTLFIVPAGYKFVHGFKK
jgi:multidrug efflux pump